MQLSLSLTWDVDAEYNCADGNDVLCTMRYDLDGLTLGDCALSALAQKVY